MTINQQTLMPSTSASAWRPAIASLIGSTVEWYDYFIYGMAAAIVIGPLFFPEFSDTAGTLAAFATFSVGFIARPFGGIVMGHFGDKVGRKAMLISSLLLMGCATVGIGLLPTYDTIGLWAPILLVVLRFLQGFGVGGEWSGAVLVAVEHAPESRRSFFGSFPQMGVPGGLIVANLVFLAASSGLDDAAFMSWGWRVPFLASAILILFGLVLRYKIEETPDFENVVENQERTAMPLLTVLREHWRAVVLMAGSFIAINAVAYMFMSYLLGYMTKQLDLSRNNVLFVTIVASVAWLAAIPIAAIRTDSIGKARVLRFGSVALLISAVALFPLIDTAHYALIAMAMLFAAVAMGIVYGPMAALFTGLFPPAVRYSGTSLGYQIGSILGGGIAPTVATGLYSAYGSSHAITLYLGIVSVISLLCIIKLTSSRQVVKGAN